MTKSYIWPLYNRGTHILLIALFISTYLFDNLYQQLDYHVIFGILFGLVFLFRVFWGFIGPKYSKFKDFNLNKDDLKDYFHSFFTKQKRYISHNPASSVAIIVMILFTFISIVTGLLVYGIGENHGLLSFLHDEYFKKMDLLKDIHEISANLLLATIAVHLIGAIIDKFVKKNDGLNSMISGYKITSTKLSIKTNNFQKVFVLLALSIFSYTSYYLLSTKDNVFIKSANLKQDYALLHSDFENECGSCHITYPPFLLPKKSWTLMMQDLENHFGDDASIDEETNISILKFLEKHSAENSTQKAAYKILTSLKKTDTIAITKTPYWERKHRKIDKELFLSQEVKSKANCKACHKNIEYGLIENSLIKIPKIKGL